MGHVDDLALEGADRVTGDPDEFGLWQAEVPCDACRVLVSQRFTVRGEVLALSEPFIEVELGPYSELTVQEARQLARALYAVALVLIEAGEQTWELLGAVTG